MNVKSSHKRKQRQHFYNLHNAEKRKQIAAHLAGDLMERYDRRSFPLRKGDIVMIQRGSLKGHTGRVSAIDSTAMRINVDGANITKADGTQVPMKIHPSNVLVTKLDLTDLKRKAAIERKTGGKAKAKSKATPSEKPKTSKTKAGKPKTSKTKADKPKTSKTKAKDGETKPKDSKAEPSKEAEK
jgi:large subunit ribosomal protein L24